MIHSSSVKKNEFRDRKSVVRIIVFTLAVAAILIAVLSSGRGNKGVETSYVKSGSITKKINSKAYFIKDELAVISDAEGKFFTEATEGTKVAKGQVIGYVIPENMEEIFSELRNAERKLAAAKNALYEYNEAYPESLTESEKSIASKAGKISKMVSEGNISGCEGIIEDILNIMESMNDDEEVDSAYISRLENKIEECRNAMNGGIYPVTAPESGIISFYVCETDAELKDLYYKISECEKNNFFGNFSAEGLENISETKTNAGRNVSAGTKVAIISKNLYDYVIVKTKSAPEGNVSFESFAAGISGKGKVIYSDSEILIVKCSAGKETFSAYNFADVSLEISSEEGMKVPVSALTDWDTPKKNARLTVVKSGIVNYIYVEILEYDSEYAIIAPHAVFGGSGYEVKVNDVFIVNYKSVREGQTIN